MLPYISLAKWKFQSCHLFLVNCFLDIIKHIVDSIIATIIIRILFISNIDSWNQNKISPKMSYLMIQYIFAQKENIFQAHTAGLTGEKFISPWNPSNRKTRANQKSIDWSKWLSLSSLILCKQQLQKM